MPHAVSRMRRSRIALGAIGLTMSSMMSGCMFWGPARAKIPIPPVALSAENVTFHSGSGSTIHAWLARGQRGDGAVLLLHGVGSNRTSMLARAELLHDEGFTVLAPDFQAHGESTGDVVTFGARESLDAQAALNFLEKAAPGERVGVIGVSMGGAASLLGPGPLAVNAFVLESVYPTIRQAVRDRLGTWLGPLGGIGKLFTPAVLDIVGSEIGVSESELQPISRIGEVHAPVLVIAGTKDPYTPLDEAEALYARAPEPKSFWPVEGAGHEDLFAYAGPEYARRVSAFLERYLRAASPTAMAASGAAGASTRTSREAP